MKDSACCKCQSLYVQPNTMSKCVSSGLNCGLKPHIKSTLKPGLGKPGLNRGTGVVLFVFLKSGLPGLDEAVFEKYRL